eukprot:scaffold112665_cov69-Phaeocystis_antarctica.AAC.6
MAAAVGRTEGRAPALQAQQALLLQNRGAASKVTREDHHHARVGLPPVLRHKRALLDHVRDEAGGRVLARPITIAQAAPLRGRIPVSPPVGRQRAGVVQIHLEVGGTPAAEEGGELAPRAGVAHVADRLDDRRLGDEASHRTGVPPTRRRVVLAKHVAYVNAVQCPCTRPREPLPETSAGEAAAVWELAALFL